MAPGGMTPNARMFKMLKENMKIKLTKDLVVPKSKGYYDGQSYEILKVQIFFDGSLVAEDVMKLDDN